jgi:hypothetical protein
MRLVSQQTTDAWKGEIKAGPTRPVVRATIEWGRIREYPYNTDDMQGGEEEAEELGVRTRKGVFRSINFNNTDVRELRNVRSISWSRSVDQDISECTLTLLNTDVTAIGDSEISLGGDADLPGLFTFSRGTQPEAQERWGHAADTGWVKQIIPDRLVRTYEGYGSDDTLPPGEDPHLYASGVWLIDRVDYDANGDIKISMRDLGRLLTDHIVFPPVIPHDDYPLEWSKIRTELVDSRDAAGGSWKQPPGSTTSSNSEYVGLGIVDEPPYVNNQGGVQGHYPHHAYLGGLTENEEGEMSGIGNEFYWLSTGQLRSSNMVWWELELDNPQNLAALKVSTRSGPYRVYVSVANEDGWFGKKKIPYEPQQGDRLDLGADIKFVTSFKSESGFPLDVTLPRKYQGVTKVRLTFTRLRKLTPAVTYPWRAGLRNLELYTADNIDDLSFVDGQIATPIGNYRDFSQIVRWIGAWAGWYWPPNAWLQYETDGTKHDMNYSTQFVSSLPKGRTWGSFQWNGTAGEADITSDQFDKQPLLDVISHVREITGDSFWIDEAGAMVWRQPNIFEVGNYVTPSHLDSNRSQDRTMEYVTIDEEETLLSYGTTLSSENIRERVFIGDVNGRYGAVVAGYSPLGGGHGFMRVAGWTDGNWERKGGGKAARKKADEECLVAADLIVARQMFDYRRANITIPGYPAIQIDDQIRVFERVTAETYFHYVLGVSNELNMDEGTWTYSLETHWLGPDREQAFILDTEELKGPTKAYLNLQGGID